MCAIYLRFIKGLNLLSKINEKDFEKILEETEQIRSTEGEEANLESVEVTVEGLSDQEKELVVKTVYYLLQRLNIFILKPTKIQADLKESLPENKIAIILKYYRKQNKTIVDSLETRHDGISDINWTLKTVLSSETQQKIAPPKTVVNLELHSNDDKVLSLDLNHQDLFELFGNLEKIQQELDARAKS